KLHAIEQLNADLTAQSTDVAIISETWFKAHHTDQAMQLSGYIIYRRDRKKRRGGGVAIYITDNVRSELYIPPNDDNRLEILWIKTQIDGQPLYIAALFLRRGFIFHFTTGC